jgi:hypothetical protein
VLRASDLTVRHKTRTQKSTHRMENSVLTLYLPGQRQALCLPKTLNLRLLCQRLSLIQDIEVIQEVRGFRRREDQDVEIVCLFL